MAPSQFKPHTPDTVTARQGRAARSAKFFGLPQLIFALPYGVMLVWFHGVDVYHRHFAEPGLVVIAYNGFRVLFIFYLFWIVATAGLLLLSVVARRELAQTGVLERLALGFFTGAGIWHVFMLALGYLDLYTVPVAIAVTLPLVILSYAPAREAADDICRAVKADDVTHDLGPDPLGWILLILAAVTFGMLLLVKGLYPGGGHDYFTHYFYYFQTVIARGGLWPNDVWDHYYYDKGAGLYFLGILITDLLAPQLVTFTFMAAAALVIFLASRVAAPGTRWPWVAVLLFLTIFLYTPYWGEFQKTHELTTALVIAVVWTAGGAFARCGKSQNAVWPVAAVSTITVAVIVTPTIAVFLSASFGLMVARYLIARDFRRARLSLVFAAIAGVLLAGTFAVNYATTGLLSDQVLLSTWSISNLDKLDQWGALPTVIAQYWGRLGYVADTLPLSHFPKMLKYSSRLDLIDPLIYTAAAIGIAALVFRLRHDRWAGTLHAPHQTGILLAAIPVFVAIALTGGRVQPLSFYRYADFVVPLMIVGAVGLWGIPVSDARNRVVRLVHDRRMPAVVFALSLFTIVKATHPASFFHTFLPSVWRFASGGISIDTGYTVQPDLPLSAIYPGARGAYSVVGPGIPIWSFHYLTYCMLPDCRIETMNSFILPKWDDVMFGNPEQARSALQASGHNYFLFSRELPLADALPLSELFSPNDIARYLGIRWTDGTTSLLTWLGPGVQPLDQAWLADYRHAVEQSETVQSFPYDAMKQIFARLNATPHPWTAFQLPW
jgi:hypothetical protein